MVREVGEAVDEGAVAGVGTHGFQRITEGFLVPILVRHRLSGWGHVWGNGVVCQSETVVRHAITTAGTLLSRGPPYRRIRDHVEEIRVPHPLISPEEGLDLLTLPQYTRRAVATSATRREPRHPPGGCLASYLCGQGLLKGGRHSAEGRGTGLADRSRHLFRAKHPHKGAS